jgi:hypothetical protein
MMRSHAQAHETSNIACSNLGGFLMKTTSFLALFALVLSLALPALADWDPGMPAKWVQMPDLSPMGVDVNATLDFILADDFLCTASGPITGIHLWGSWRNDYLPFGGDPMGVFFRFSIHADIPANQNPDGYSIPGDLLWERTFQPGEFTARQFGEGPEGWMDPPDEYGFPADYFCWQYNFRIDPTEAFFQQGSPDQPIVYWLDVQAQPIDPQAFFGWKTSVEHWNDDAVWGRGVEPFMGPWFELRYPPQHEMYGQSIDLAFVLTGEPTLEEDFGDAPDTYRTLLASFGPQHTILPVIPGIHLGASVDGEPNGQPSILADGDDLAGIDDEDGVVFTSLLQIGQPATVDVTASVNGFLDAWVDFGHDGTFSEAGDQIYASLPLVAGLNSLNFFVPAAAIPGQTYARFRFSTVGGLSYAGPAPDGEVEDYMVEIREQQTWKWRQEPDLSPLGIDVNATEPYILADDWLCTEPGRITTITIWGSWLEDYLPFQGDPLAVFFRLSIHQDIPAGPVPYSMPGELVWFMEFPPGSFEWSIYADDILEGWMDPPEMYFFPADHQCFMYTFHIDPANAFLQEGNDTVYWLDVQAQPADPVAHFGWKSSPEHWNDDAVWGMGIEPYPGPWEELRYPPQHELFGHSIDLAFMLQSEPVELLDFGDAPDPTYPTLLASNGAAHIIVPGFMLGGSIDFELNGQPTPAADGDDLGGIDDEDGVFFTSPLRPGGPATVDVIASAPGMLDAWIDFQGDGNWLQAMDVVFAAQPLAPGLNTLSFNLPATGLPALTTYARFRFSSMGGLPPFGLAPDGEVEDYQVRIDDDLSRTPDAIPQRFGLRQNVPNPFNPLTTILFDLPEARHATLTVYAVDGRKVATLVDAMLPAGTHSAQWNGRDGTGQPVASGTYFYRLEAGDVRLTERMQLVR